MGETSISMRDTFICMPETSICVPETFICMRETVLYIAMSLDGYIADARGSVDWLQGAEASAEMPDTYGEFLETVDTVIMGATTYRQIVTELSPDAWPYAGLEAYVLTHSLLADRAGVTFVNGSPSALIDALRSRAGKNIWICGGADIARQLLEADKIDRIILSVIPVLLGTGLPLFPDQRRLTRLHLLRTRALNGIVEVEYAVIRR